MSVSLIPTAIGGAQAAVSTASQIANILAGFKPSLSGQSIITRLAKDIGTFEFDYIGEERVEAGADITVHYSETNDFMQDHAAIRPRIIVMRGFVAENSINKSALLPTLTSLASALTPITPYLGTYAPGTAAKMAKAVSQTDQIIQQLAQLQAIAGGVGKLLQTVGALPGQPTKVMQAFNTLDALRIGGATFAAVTPWGTFGDNPPNDKLAPVMIESLVGIGPEDTRGWADFMVRLTEVRVAPSLLAATLDNARAPGASSSAPNGSVSGAP